MSRSQFFNKKKEFLTLQQIVDITGVTLPDNIDANLKVLDVATIDKADSGQISFINAGRYVEKLSQTKAGFCLMEEKFLAKTPKGTIALIHKNPYFAYSQIAAAFWEEKPEEFSDKLIHSTAQIGEGTKIAANSFIGKDVKIGKNCFIGPAVTIMNGCEIGDNCIINSSATVSFAKIGANCIIYSGAKIGQDGFGFAHNAGVNHKIIQLGIVEIGNSVEIGANSCVDRGAIENTIISDGVKIDNLVQIAHNVIIGKGTVIAGCSAVAGSVKIGNFVQIGGNSSINGHTTIGDGAKIAGMTGVVRDVVPMQAVSGTPAMDLRKWIKLNTILAKKVS